MVLIHEVIDCWFEPWWLGVDYLVKARGIIITIVTDVKWHDSEAVLTTEMHSFIISPIRSWVSKICHTFYPVEISCYIWRLCDSDAYMYLSFMWTQHVTQVRRQEISTKLCWLNLFKVYRSSPSYQTLSPLPIEKSIFSRFSCKSCTGGTLNSLISNHIFVHRFYYHRYYYYFYSDIHPHYPICGVVWRLQRM